jgi:hypothetical protein
MNFAVPFAFATVAAASELFVLYRKETHGPTKALNTVTGWIATVWFCWVSWDLFTTIWLKGEWKNLFDFTSTTLYIGCLIPLIGMAVSDLPWVKIRKRPERRLALHAGFLAMLLVMLFVALTAAMWNG